MGRFDIRGRLGDGGGGVVFRAYDRKLEHEVALKLMHQREGSDLSRFVASFATLSQLAHPNLVQLYDLVEEGERVLLVMELIEGVDLLSYVRRERGGFDELRVRAAFGQLALGLSALHEHRKVHRDVKPANVRVTGQGRVVVLDLDLAIDLDDARGEWALDPNARPVGTALYMAPEQAASLRLSPACDWYSSGVVLYEALTGTRPFSGSDLEILLAKQTTEPMAPRDLVPNLPLDLERLCIDLLRADPAERPTGPAILRRLGVHEDVLSARWTSASLLSARPTFVGRSAELSQIGRAFERSRGELTVLRVVGEAGTGKTSLCEEALRRFVHHDAAVLALSSSCPRYAEKPHAPLHEPVARASEALRGGRASVRLAVGASALRLLERAFPGAVIGLEAKSQGRTALAPEPLEQRWRAIAALRALFVELCEARPVVLWLDDYHWADVDTKRFVGSLVAGSEAPRMLLLLSEDPEPGLVSSSLPKAHETIALGKLSCEDARSLLEDLRTRAGPAASELDAALDAERSPLLIRERVRHVLLYGDSASDETSFPALLGRRIRELPEPALRVLELVCAAYDALPQAVCERAAELAPIDLTRHVAALAIAGLVRSQARGGEDVLAPSHPLVAEYVDLELQGPRRVVIHEKLAGAFVAHDLARFAGRLLRHQGESGDHLRAAESAARAAEEAYGALAFQRAAELFTLCASLRPPPHDERGHRLLRRMAEALGAAGWTLSAATVYREAAQYASAADALHMRQRSIEYLLRGAEVEEGEQAIGELLTSLGVALPSSRLRALWSLRRHRVAMGLFGLGFREVDESRIPASELRRLDVLFTCGAQLLLVNAVVGAELLTRSLLWTRAAGEPRRMARALCTEAWNFVGRSSVDEARSHSLIDAARALTERHDAPLLDGHVRLARGMVALGTYQVRECRVHCRDAERVFRDSCADVLWELSTAQVHQVFAISLMGRYRELAPKLLLYRREADERGDVWTYTALLGVEALGVSLARDTPEEAESHVREARSRWGAHDHGLHTQVLFSLLAEGAVDLYRGHDHADERMKDRLEELDAKQFIKVPLVRIAMGELRARTRISSAVRRKDLAKLTAVQAMARKLFGEGDAAAAGFGHLLMANVHVLHGAPERAIFAIEQGIAALDPLGLGQWVVPARLVLGRLIGGERGGAMEETARTQLRQRGVQHADRFTTMMMPACAQLLR